MTLRHKLLITFVILLVLVGVQGATAFVLLTRVVEDSAQLVRPALGRVDMLAHLEADVLRLHALEHTRDVEVQAEIAQLDLNIQRYLRDYGLQDLDETRRQMIGSAAQQYADLVADPLSESTFQRLDTQLHQLRHVEYSVTETLRDTMVGEASWARWPLALVVVAVALVEVGLGWYVSRGIMRSLQALSAGARRIAMEQFGTPVSRPAEPEFAQLAATLNGVMLELANNHSQRARAEAERLELMRGRLVQIVRAQEEERARLSRDLHDQAGQALTALKYGLDHLQRIAPDQAFRHEVCELVELASATTRQLGALARDLRPSLLDDLGLVPALRSLVREYSDRYALVADVRLSGAIPRLASEAETALYRVVQEALTNVARHANASHVEVKFAYRDTVLRIEVRDDGHGFDPSRPRTGLGLAGIQERVQLLGGAFEVRSQPGRGTVVAVSLSVEDTVTPEPEMAVV